MGYELTRSYDTDLSRTDARIILANLAHELAEADGRDLPTQTVFEEPDIVDEEDNWFRVRVRPTVLGAGFEPQDLIPGGCVRMGETFVQLLGHDREEASVIVRKAEPNDERMEPSFETVKELRRKRA